MELSDEEFNEFKLEAFELLDNSEKSLLAIDGGGDFHSAYDAIFRAFHNLKGSAGMLEITALQSHMHKMETTLMQQKEVGSLTPELTDYFLKGCDLARRILENKGQNVDGDNSSTQHQSAVATQTHSTSPSTDPEINRSVEKTPGPQSLRLLLRNYVGLRSYLEKTGQFESLNQLNQSIEQVLQGEAAGKGSSQ